MGEVTKIEWTDHTFNAWIGCTKVSPACDGCYAENLMDHRYGRVTWGPGEDRKRTSKENWRKPLKWNREAQGKTGPTYVFCSSLADVFDNEVDPIWRRDLFKLIEDTPFLTWLLLTKRIGNVIKMTDVLAGNPMLPDNVAIGATIANQAEYDRDAYKLREVKERLEPVFTFGSFEPILGPITMDEYAPDWCIVGGETTQGRHKARDADPEWMRSMLSQTRRLGRKFFMKQMARKAPIPADLLVREFPT